MVKALLACLCAAALAAADQGGYTLFPGDVVRIEVYGHADLLVDARIPTQGDVTFPLIGSLSRLAGRTPEALAAEVTRRLADGYIRNPSVTVQVREYGSRSAWVMGAVHTPGAIKLDPLRPASALQAIGAAGGFDDDADREAAQLVRDDPANPGRTIALPLSSATIQQGLELVHGDVILVPRADRIYVLGQVQGPRAVPLPANEALTVSKAVSLAGGFARFAQESRVQLIRRGAQPATVDVRAVLDGGRNAEDPVLKGGDTVFVPESRF